MGAWGGGCVGGGVGVGGGGDGGVLLTDTPYCEAWLLTTSWHTKYYPAVKLATCTHMYINFVHILLCTCMH